MKDPGIHSSRIWKESPWERQAESEGVKDANMSCPWGLWGGLRQGPSLSLSPPITHGRVTGGHLLNLLQRRPSQAANGDAGLSLGGGEGRGSESQRVILQEHSRRPMYASLLVLFRKCAHTPVDSCRLLNGQTGPIFRGATGMFSDFFPVPG